MTKTRALWIDLALIAILALWYAIVTPHAPRQASPTTGQVYEMPVFAGYTPTPRPPGYTGLSVARQGMTRAIFRSGFVTFPVLLIGWLFIVNTALLMLWVVVSFFRVLWSPAPPGWSDAASSSGETGDY